ncbi:MAG: manganese efflux pump MntP family protein [Clostridiales bacterium]|jgi:putative Mn2+ efflux pump MntP|nr:manganese efflux pump MntP family protein [Clostridiales bacterium]
MNDWIALILLGAGLSADAFAVSICDGISYKNLSVPRMTFIAGVFGAMQGIMPLLGYLLGGLFIRYIENALPWISFALLLVIGGKTLYEGIKAVLKKEEPTEKLFSPSAILIQGVATSIDALAVGVSMLSFSISIWISAPVIAAITFSLSLLAVFLGTKFGSLLKGKSGIADIIGGTVLIALGISFVLRSYV